MSRATVSVFRASKLAADLFLSAVVETWRRFKKGTFDPYRPELHYMRGPGPKWREKHARAGSIRSMSVPVQSMSMKSSLGHFQSIGR
jgi:hypothetical protein